MLIVNLNTAPWHIPLLAEWHHRQWSYLNQRGTLQQRCAELRTHVSAAPIPSTYLALHDDTQALMGSASLVVDDMDTHPELTPWLASVFVNPHYRKQGIGAALVQHVMMQARAAGSKMLWLFTPDQENFYRQLGWRTVAQEIYRGSEVTIMQVIFSELREPLSIPAQ